jgi:hypothetical protein
MNFWKVRGSHRRSTSFSGARIGLGALGVATLSFVTVLGFGGQSAFAATSPTLGAADPYAVIAGVAITNTGSSVITGNIGLSPGAASSITGFPPGTVSGTTDAADAASLAAQNAATAAYLVAAGESSTGTVAGGDLGGSTLTPGVYTSASSLALTGTVTLNGGGDANAVFIFQAGSTLTTAPGSSVVLENGAQACNVFWQVGSSATLNTTTSFNGTILALTSATLDTGATVNGRVLAQTGAVTLDGNTITVPTCAAATTTTTTTIAPTTTTTVAPTTTTTIAPTTTTTVAPTTTTTTHHSTTTSTTVPVGAPATGEGGASGSGTPKGLIGFSALAVALAAGSVALRSRRQRGRASSGGHSRGS